MPRRARTQPPQRRRHPRRGGRGDRALPRHGVRARRHAEALLPQRPPAAAGPDRRSGVQVRDGAGLCLPPGADPPRREAGQPAGRAGRVGAGRRRQGQRLRLGAEPERRLDADPPRRLAGLHAAGTDRRRRRGLPRRRLRAGRRAVSPHQRPPTVRRAAPDGADASDLPPAAAAAGGAARGRHGSARRRRAARAGQASARTLCRLGRLRAGVVQPGRQPADPDEPAGRGARLGALQHAARAGVLRRLRRRAAVGGGAARALAALPARPCALQARPGGQQLPHHCPRRGAGVPRQPARRHAGPGHVGRRDGLSRAQPRPAQAQHRHQGDAGVHDHLLRA
ncbi:unnamed protein product [Rotaria sp. Silwood1]|nr:unnamed protein product [Rotaria sp. Silwood1]